MQKLPVKKFELIEHISQFNEDFIKHYNSIIKEVVKDIFDVDVQYTETWHEHHNDLPFLLEKMKIGKVKKNFQKFKTSIKSSITF